MEMLHLSKNHCESHISLKGCALSHSLSGTESAILNRESGDSELYDLNCQVQVRGESCLNIDRLQFLVGDSHLINRFSPILLPTVRLNFVLLAAETLAIPGLRF